MASASSSSLKVVTETTGPKISSWKTRMLLSAAEHGRLDVVAAGQVAAQLARAPPASTSAPSARPMSK